MKWLNIVVSNVVCVDACCFCWCCVEVEAEWLIGGMTSDSTFASRDLYAGTGQVNHGRHTLPVQVTWGSMVVWCLMVTTLYGLLQDVWRFDLRRHQWTSMCHSHLPANCLWHVGRIKVTERLSSVEVIDFTDSRPNWRNITENYPHYNNHYYCIRCL